MKDLSSTQFFQVESGPQIQAKDILEPDGRIYYVRGSDLYHQPQRRQKSDHEDGAGRTGGRDAENVY